jgi:DNA-binding HxlR family transcriptional regulator
MFINFNKKQVFKLQIYYFCIMSKVTQNNIEFRSLCPVATGLDIIGDKWTLLILRDMIWGHKTMFNEFKTSPELMPSKMLSNRLKKLEELGYISKNKGTINKKNIYYFLEPKGMETLPMMVEMAMFTTKYYFHHLGNTYTKDVKTKMAKNKAAYITEMNKSYKTFVKTLSI